VHDLVVHGGEGDVGIELLHQRVGVSLVDGGDRAVLERAQLGVQGLLRGPRRLRVRGGHAQRAAQQQRQIRTTSVKIH
jgi:hypothetical protein